MKKATFTFLVLLFSISSFAQLRSKATPVTTFGGSDGTITLDIRGGTPPYSYFWNNGSTEQNLSNLSSGVYTVSITDQHECTYTLGFNVSEPGPSGSNKSINNGHFTSSIQCYPNPSEGHFNLKFSADPNTNFSLRVMDISGKVLIENNYDKFTGEYNGQFDLSNRARGIYFIQVRSDKEILNQKVIVN